MSPVSKGRKRKPAKTKRKYPRTNLPDWRSAPAFEPAVDTASYLADLPSAASTADVERTLDRRMFALPYQGAVIRGEKFSELNPADPDERRLLIEGEHPEFQEELADLTRVHGPEDDHNPRLHLAVHEIIANQLWDDQPAEAWQAAQRLRKQGLDRHDILHALAAVLTTHMHPTPAQGQKFDDDAYRQDLDELGRRRGPVPIRVEPSNSTYRIRVGIAGSEPEIWRRLSLPGDIRLNTLHQVIQTAFGWDGWHPHEFEATGRHAAAIDEREVTLAALAPDEGSRLRYVYDFGDNWVHDILVEEIDRTHAATQVVCLDAERAGPPEDSGGVFGYRRMLDAVADLEHPDHDDELEWLGEDFDPAAVDREAINATLGRFGV